MRHTDDQDRGPNQASLCATAPEGRGWREKEEGRGGVQKKVGEKNERAKVDPSLLCAPLAGFLVVRSDTLPLFFPVTQPFH